MSEEDYNEGYNQGVKDTIQEIIDVVNMSDGPKTWKCIYVIILKKRGLKYDT